jgi:hypothetical protein
MSQERWDIVLRFLDGPLAMREDLVLQGPVVRVGADPGPDGLRLEGYRGIDARQATITTYGGRPQVGPVGQAQVRVAPHEHVSWSEIHPLRGPVHLTDGAAVHFGPPERGCTAVMVTCQRLGVWEQRAILSDASQAELQPEATNVESIDATRRYPAWLIPGFLAVLTTFLGALGVLFFVQSQRDVDQLGPIDDGQETYDFDAAKEEKVPAALYAGVEQAFHAFLMKDNAAAAADPSLEKPEAWDRNLMEWTARAETLHGRGWAFWQQLDAVREHYAYVVGELRKQGLPDALAGVPFQESRYKATAFDTMLCARGWWQFQPEVANRAGIRIQRCHLKGSDTPWTPVELAPPINIMKNAIYVENGSCRITGCDVDERSELQVATRGAIKLLKEAYDDPDLRASGAVVQMTIASHNAGYDNAPYQKFKNVYNVRHAYAAFRAEQKVDRAPDFIGRNITCVAKGQAQNFNDRCGGYLANVTQMYVPYVLAQHMLAVCYYGTNYSDDFKVFGDYRTYVRGNGYCKDIKVPTRDEIAKRAGVRK